MEAFVSSGRLEHLESAELRDALLVWTSVVADLRDDEDMTQEHVMGAILPYLRDEFDVARSIALVLPIYRGTLNSDELSETRLRSTATLRALVAWHVNLLELLALQSRSAVDRLDRLIVLIEKELS